jgi:hypothetical protein
MNIQKVIQTVADFFSESLQKPGVVIGVLPEQDGWKVDIEVAEEVEYMRKRARNDLMAIYEVLVNDNLEITGFERKTLRERSSTTTTG